MNLWHWQSKYSNITLVKMAKKGPACGWQWGMAGVWVPVGKSARKVALERPLCRDSEAVSSNPRRQICCAGEPRVLLCNTFQKWERIKIERERKRTGWYWEKRRERRKVSYWFPTVQSICLSVMDCSPGDPKRKGKCFCLQEWTLNLMETWYIGRAQT